jgi:hypothetical protein
LNYLDMAEKGGSSGRISSLLVLVITVIIAPLILMTDPPFWWPELKEMVIRFRDRMSEKSAGENLSKSESSEGGALGSSISSSSFVFEDGGQLLEVAKTLDIDKEVIYSKTSRRNPWIIGFSVGQYGKRVQGYFDPARSMSEISQGWLSFKCYPNQTLRITAIQGKVGIYITKQPEGEKLLNATLDEGSTVEERIEARLAKGNLDSNKTIELQVEVQHENLNHPLHSDLAFMCLD